MRLNTFYYISVFLLFNFLACFNSFSDTIILKNGKRVEGIVKERTPDFIIIDFYGVPLKYYTDDIKEIQTTTRKIPVHTQSYKYNIHKITKGSCFLWKIKSKRNVVYLLGSIHFGTKKLYPLNKKIEGAFRRSSVLAVEANINNINILDTLGLYLDYALYKNGKTLKDTLDKKTYELTKKKLEDTGLSIEQLNMYKPWYVALLLQQTEYNSLGYEQQYGIDAYFLNKAEGKKKIVELESLESHFKLLSSLSDQEQSLLLYYTILDIDNTNRFMNVIINAWRRGDTKTINEIIRKTLLQNPRLTSFFEKLLYKRNRTMAEKIKKFINDNCDYFIVVGAAHLVGDKSIISMLEDEGYNIEQL